VASTKNLKIKVNVGKRNKHVTKAVEND